MSFFSRVLENRVLIIALVAWTVAQVGKVIFEIRLNKRVVKN